MTIRKTLGRMLVVAIAACVGVSVMWSAGATRAQAGDDGFRSAAPQAPPKSTKKKKKKKKKSSKKSSANKDDRIRWGQRRTETDKKYDKRYARLLKKIKRDKRGDFTDGMFDGGEGEEVRLWTYMGHPFIVRTDISKEFTADAAMYMEMLHREYSRAFSKLLGKPADLREKIEVIIFADRKTYMKNGGSPGSGGFFHPAVQFLNDRGPHWPARHYRLQQFTDGIEEFSKWPKGTLKHEAAHMELQLRLGYTLFYDLPFAIPIRAPNWFNEGQASVFEYWDFDKTVEENFEEIPNRGRYARFVRRLFSTDRWKDFHYVWTIDPQTWHRDMTKEQGYFNYCQAWSLAGYMMNDGKRGQRDFRAVFDLSKRVGVDRQTTWAGDRKRAWETEFDDRDRDRLEKNWTNWVSRSLSRDYRVPDEDYFMRRMMYNPEIVERLQKYTKDEIEEVKKQLEEEGERRKDPNRVER